MVWCGMLGRIVGVGWLVGWVIIPPQKGFVSSCDLASCEFYVEIEIEIELIDCLTFKSL